MLTDWNYVSFTRARDYLNKHPKLKKLPSSAKETIIYSHGSGKRHDIVYAHLERFRVLAYKLGGRNMSVYDILVLYDWFSDHDHYKDFKKDLEAYKKENKDSSTMRRHSKFQTTIQKKNPTRRSKQP